jgi:hypothetical protein
LGALPTESTSKTPFPFVLPLSTSCFFLNKDLLRERGSLVILSFEALLFILSLEGLLMSTASLFALSGFGLLLILKGESLIEAGSVMLLSRWVWKEGSELRGRGRELLASLAFLLEEKEGARLTLGESFFSLVLFRSFLSS